MTRNPFANAIVAVLYISLVASVMFYSERMAGPTNSILVPIAFISVFTLSAAVMGYVFLYQPVQLYLEGKKKMAVNLFLQTVGFFALITVCALTLLFTKVVH